MPYRLVDVRSAGAPTVQHNQELLAPYDRDTRPGVARLVGSWIVTVPEWTALVFCAYAPVLYPFSDAKRYPYASARNEGLSTEELLAWVSKDPETRSAQVLALAELVLAGDAKALEHGVTAFVRAQTHPKGFGGASRRRA